MKAVSLKVVSLLLLLVIAPLNLGLTAATDEEKRLIEKAEQLKSKVEQKKPNSLQLTPTVFFTTLVQKAAEGSDLNKVERIIGLETDFSYQWNSRNHFLLATQGSFNYSVLHDVKQVTSGGFVKEEIDPKKTYIFAGIDVKPLYAYDSKTPKIGAYLKVGFIRERTHHEDDALYKVVYDIGLTTSWDSFRIGIFQPELFDCSLFARSIGLGFIDVSCRMVGASLFYLIPVVGLDLGISGLHSLAEEKKIDSLPISEKETVALAWTVNFGTGVEFHLQLLEELIFVFNTTMKAEIGRTLFRPKLEQFPARLGFWLDVTVDLHVGQNFNATLGYGLNISNVGNNIYDKYTSSSIVRSKAGINTNKISLNFAYAW